MASRNTRTALMHDALGRYALQQAIELAAQLVSGLETTIFLDIQ